MLKASGVDLDARNTEGETPLIISARTNKIDSLRFLLQCGVDVNASDHFERTALSTAVHFNHDAMQDDLKSYGAQQTFSVTAHRPPDRSMTVSPDPVHFAHRDLRISRPDAFVMRHYDLLTTPPSCIDDSILDNVLIRKSAGRCLYCASSDHAMENCQGYLHDCLGILVDSLPAVRTLNDHDREVIQIRWRFNACLYCGLQGHEWANCRDRLVRMQMRERVRRVGYLAPWTEEEMDRIGLTDFAALKVTQTKAVGGWTTLPRMP